MLAAGHFGVVDGIHKGEGTASMLTMLVGVVLVTVEIRFSRRSLVFEAQRVTRLSADGTAATVSETNAYGYFRLCAGRASLSGRSATGSYPDDT